MAIITISEREFTQKLLQATKNDRVIIVDEQNRPAYALLRFDEYKKILTDDNAKEKNIADLLSTPEVADLEFNFPYLRRN